MPVAAVAQPRIQRLMLSMVRVLEMVEMVSAPTSWVPPSSLAVVAVAQAIPEVLPATEDKVVAVAVAVGQGVLWVPEVPVD
jgi:hypothetical protein